MNIADLQATLRQFAADRDWQPFQTPKNLAMAMMVEAGELGEIFQWMTGEQSAQAWRDPAVKQHIGEEIADVLFYLLQIADHTHTDLQRAVDAKLVINGRKYPPKRPVGALPPPPVVVAGAAVAAGRTHVLLDYENVQPDTAALRALVPDIAEVWLFHGPHQKNPGRHLADLPLTLVPISKTGKNALDFHLTFYVGFISARHPADRIVVVANDQGYEPMLMHARTMGFDVRLQTLPSAPRKPAATRQPAATSRAAPARKQAAPARKKALAAAPPSAAVPASPAPAAKAARKKAPAKASPSRATPAAAAKAKAAPAAPARKAATRTAAARPAAPAQASPAQPAAAPRPAAKKAAPAQRKPPARPAADVVKAAALQKLLANLRRAGDQRPGTRAPLLRALLAWLGAGHTSDEAAAALQQLADAGYLEVTPAGRVSYRL